MLASLLPLTAWRRAGEQTAGDDKAPIGGRSSDTHSVGYYSQECAVKIEKLARPMNGPGPDGTFLRRLQRLVWKIDETEGVH